MVFRKRILPITVAMAFTALSAFGSSPQTSAPAASREVAKSKAQPKAKDHVFRGSVVVLSNDVLTARSGKKDTIFKIDSSTRKPDSLGPGSQIAVTYRDEGKQHIASNIELSAVAAKSPSRK